MALRWLLAVLMASSGLCLAPCCRAFQNDAELREAVRRWDWRSERPGLISIYGDIAHWDVGMVTDMSRLFSDTSFNEAIGTWNTSAVTDMQYMFAYAENFNQPIGSWNTSAVTDMKYMFSDAKKFNQPIGSWDTSAVKDMQGMFRYAKKFNQPIGSWNTLAVTDMKYMFFKAKKFNQPIGSWDTSAVTDMNRMFYEAYDFNQPIGSWNTSAVTDMRYMFSSAEKFNQPIGSWNTAAVTDMSSMFDGARNFNQPIGSWDTSAVTDMQFMFYNATSFNAALGLWDISSLRRHDQFHRLQPPCEAGRGPGRNNLMCEKCRVGQYAPARSYCQECPEGSTPSADRSTCEDCPAMHYSVSGLDECLRCNFPLVSVGNHCVWWHLPLLAIGLGALGVGSCSIVFWNRFRKAKKIERILEEIYAQLWDEHPDAFDTCLKKWHSLRLRKTNFDQHISAMRSLQSHRAGVSIEYLLSADFAQLAVQRTGKDDPTFIDMKTGFWLSENPIGKDIICPRDGRSGCALVDWMPRRERREQTHFMSWTWKYSLQQVRSALGTFQQSLVGRCYFFMCFFANNQYRILVEESSNGSDHLEEVFETNLRRIGKMVAILDTWDQPAYLTRVWTVYEQFVASTLQIEVEFIMPKKASDLMQRQIAQGPDGIDEVIKSLSQVNSEAAKAWKMEDEIKVKSLIQDTVGFEHVDAHVTNVMIAWIGGIVEQTCREFARLLDRARGEQVLKKADHRQAADDQRSKRISL